MRRIYWALLSCALCGTALAQENAKGVVFVDANGNGIRDKKEIGLSGVSVSNGTEVVQTDAEGHYTLPVQKDNIIFAVKPSGYTFGVDENNHPKFYYIYKPEGSPKMKYAGVVPTGKLPKSIDFALTTVEEPTKFSAFIFGDSQAYTAEEMEFFRKAVVEEAKLRKGPLLGITLGDLVGDDLSLHPSYKQVIGQMGLPWYNVIGNHDMNLDATNDSLSDESFEKTFGPANYAFNVANTHFMVLDDILYPHPKKGKGYQGGFRKDQLDFIANNLRFVSKDKLLVVALHIPLNPDNDDSFRKEDRQRLFDLFADYPNTLFLSAHTHFQQQNYYTAEDGWKGAKPLHEYNVGTTAGDWYSGQLDDKGIPVSTMRDGTPKGYATLTIDNNQYTFDYKVVGKEDNYTIGLFGPAVVAEKFVKRYPVYANFYIGSENDAVRYRIDEGEWKEMKRVEENDPAYTKDLLTFDGATSLVAGRRPSDAVPSKHLWRFNLPKLKVGKHRVEVEAKDIFGRLHQAQKDVEVVK